MVTRGLMGRACAMAILAWGSALTACGDEEKTPPRIQSFTVTPTSLPAGGGAVQVAWQVTGATTLTLEPGTGVPPAGRSGSATVNVTQTQTFTLTAVNDSGLEAATVQVVVAPGPAIVTVNGKVLALNGSPAPSVQVQVIDANGSKPLVTTDAAGAFSVPEVLPPYSLSAVPAAPSTAAAQTWEDLTRLDPTVVLRRFLAADEFCTPADGTISGSLADAVGTGNDANVYFLSEGVHHLALSAHVAQNLNAGENRYTLTVPFSRVRCPAEMSGKVVYLESNAGAYVKAAVYDVSVSPGGLSRQNISPAVVTTGVVAGTAAFPVGASKAQFYPVLSLGEANVILSTVEGTTATSQPFSVVLPILPGLQYRILALKSLATTGAWFTSGPVSPGTTDLTLAVPTPGTPVSPSGPVTDATPDFSVTGVSGIDLYTQALPVGGTAWLGSSADGTVSLPNLPAPVVLTPGKYGWSPVNAAASRSGGGPDAMLDGRLVAGGFLYTDAMYEPELFKAGFFKSELIPFTIP